MKNSWYYIAAKNDLLKESDVNWKSIGLGAGALGAGALGAGLLMNNVPSQQAKPSQPTRQVAPIAQPSPKTQPTKPKEIEQPKAVEKAVQIPQEIKSSFVSDEELQSFISPWEGGARSEAYKDDLGIWTIGVGFNLESPNAPSILKQIGANKNDLIAKRSTLNNEQISKLFKINLKTAIADAKNWIPNLESQPKEVQQICIDMSFNMGGPTLSQFQKSGKYIINKNYAQAAKELERSKWFGQVGNRSRHHVSVLKNLAGKTNSSEKGE